MNLLQIIETCTQLPFKQKKRASKQEWAGPCPFCKTGTDRFIIFPSDERPAYWCRVCNSKGGAATFIARYFQITIPQALDRLYADFGVDIQRYEPVTKEEIPKAPTLADYRDFKLDIRYVEDWHNTGRDKAIQYFSRWGLEPKDVDRHMLGFYDCGDHEVYTIPHFYIQDEQYYLKGVKLRNVKPSIDERGDWCDKIDKRQRFTSVSGSHVNGVYNPQWVSNADGSRDGLIINQLAIVEAEKDAILLESLGVPSIRFGDKIEWTYYLPYILHNIVEPVFIYDEDDGRGLTNALNISKRLKTPHRFESTKKYNVKSPSDLAKEYGRGAVLDFLKEIKIDIIDMDEYR